jgi:F0F1-type ATP synthase assembly protein I
MKKAADHPTTSNADGEANFGISAILLDLADTTWRILVPVVIFSGLGMFIDIKAHTKPWVTLAGMVVGFIIAGVLVKRLLQRARGIEDKS